MACAVFKAEPERLRAPSRVVASDDEPSAYAETMPFIAGLEACETLVDAVVAFGDASSGCAASGGALITCAGSDLVFMKEGSSMLNTTSYSSDAL